MMTNAITTKHRLLIVVAVLALLLPLWNVPATAQSDEEIARIESAAPSAATATPKQGRSLLVFDLCRGYAHSSIPYCNKAMEILGQKTGAFNVVVSSDPDMFRPENLARFDAVLMNNTTGSPFTDPAMKQALLDFVASGKGLAGIHAATDCFYDWPEYGELMGGYFDGHPWGAGDTVGVRSDDPGHPLVAAFKGAPFMIKDEIYQLREPYSRATHRVLLSLDPATTDLQKNGVKRTDGDFAVSMIRTYGKGRVFYCSLGHNHDVFWNPAVLQHYLDGIQFALGDLKADATPNAQASAKKSRASWLAVRDRFYAEAVAEAASYDYGRPETALGRITGYAEQAAGHPEDREALADLLAGLLGSPEATAPARQFAARILWRIAGPGQVRAIAPLLTDPALSHEARYAMKGIEDPGAARALRSALGDAPDALVPGLNTDIGERRDSRAVSRLKKLGRSEDPDIARAAAMALGKINGRAARRALLYMEPSRDAGDGLIERASALKAEGRTKNAAKVFDRVFENPAYPEAVRAAALRGQILMADRPADILFETLAGEDWVLREAALTAAREVPGNVFTQEVAQRAASVPEATQVLLIDLLAARAPVPDSRAVALALVESENEVARVAGLMALGNLADAKTAPLLVGKMMGEPSNEQKAARESLVRLADNGADGVLLQEMAGADSDKTVAILGVLADRVSRSALLSVVEAARTGDAAVRMAAWSTIAVIGAPSDVKRLITLLGEEQSSVVLAAAADAMGVLTHKVGDPEKAARAILAGLPAAADNARARVALIALSGEHPCAASFDALVNALDDEAPAVADAAVAALAAWPGDEAVPVLEHIAETTGSPARRKMALRACTRILVQSVAGTEAIIPYADRFLAQAREGSEAERYEALRGYFDAATQAALKGDAAGALDMFHTGLTEVPMPMNPDQGGKLYLDDDVIEGIFELLGNQDDLDRAKAYVVAQIAYAHARDHEAILRAAAQMERFGAAPDARALRGCITQWHIAGPFDYESIQDMHPPEEGFDPEATFVGRRGAPVRWVPYTVDSSDGYIPLARMMPELAGVVAYARAVVIVPEAVSARLLFGSNDGAQVWANGNQVYCEDVGRGTVPDEEAAHVQLDAGENVVLFKVTQRGGNWDFTARLVGSEDQPVRFAQ